MVAKHGNLPIEMSMLTAEVNHYMIFDSEMKWRDMQFHATHMMYIHLMEELTGTLLMLRIH